MKPVTPRRTLNGRRTPGGRTRFSRLPIGERFALISLTAAIATPRVTFVALLVWGGVAAVYTVRGACIAYGRSPDLPRRY